MSSRPRAAVVAGGPARLPGAGRARRRGGAAIEGESVASEAERLARAREVARSATGEDALELRAALSRALAGLEAGATAQGALAEMCEASTALTDAPSALGTNGGQPAIEATREELVTVLESTFQPELFDPYCTPAALGPGGRPLHDSLVVFCSKPWFERLCITVLVAYCVMNIPFLCGVPGLFSALTWTTWLLLLAFLTVMNQICSLQ